MAIPEEWSRREMEDEDSQKDGVHQIGRHTPKLKRVKQSEEEQ